jgi:hypothetical protein
MAEMSFVSFGDGDERLKVVMPLARNQPYTVIYATLLIVWIAATVVLLALLVQQPIRSMEFVYILVYLLIVAVWAYVWYRLGKHVMRYLGYYGATREILFVNERTLIIRRPLSLLGVTDAYDMAHVGLFHYDESQHAIGFDYGSRSGLFGSGLDRTGAEQLADYLNKRYFPGRDSSDQDDIFS